jgi:uncharacterized membrane protein YhhN
MVGLLANQTSQGEWKRSHLFLLSLLVWNHPATLYFRKVFLRNLMLCVTGRVVKEHPSSWIYILRYAAFLHFVLGMHLQEIFSGFLS